MGVSKIGVPQNGWYIMKTLLKWMIWGYAYFWKHPHTVLICNIINSQLSILEAWIQRCGHASAEVVGHWPSACCPAPTWWMWQASLQFAELLAMVGSRKNAKKRHKLDETYINRWHLVTLPDFENLKSAENAMNQGSTTIETTPPWNLHFRTWKWMVGILVFFWGSAYFEWQGVYPKNPTILLGSLNLRLVLRRPSQKFPSCFSAPKFWAWLLRKRQPFFDSSWQHPGK